MKTTSDLFLHNPEEFTMKSMHRNPQFKKSPLAVLLAAALLPGAACALDLAQAPPGTQSSYVAPNVIMSLDDSGSMNTDDMINVRWQCDWRGRNCRMRGDKTRVQVLKDAVKEVFEDEELLPDGKIRLAWQTMSNCNNAGPRLTANSTGRNAMRVLNATHRANFLADMRNLGICGWTPTHQMMKHADQYLRDSSLTKNSPWASVPGKTGAPFLGCRRNYHILLTDGQWNTQFAYTSPKNYDGTSKPLPDGKLYNISSDQTRIYRDDSTYDYDTATRRNVGTQYTNIADWAFKSWADPLKELSEFDRSIGPVPDAAYRNAPDTETFTNQINLAQPSLPKTVTLDKYWNPRYNPATWVHMTTFTIGFSTDALPASPYLDKPSEFLPYGYDGSFANLANGSEQWDAGWDRGQDMWHAAINGRGKFYAVERGEDLALAFREIVKTINVATEQGRSALALSGTNMTRHSVGMYTSEYNPIKAWSGSISASMIHPDGTVDPLLPPGWGGKTTADRLDAMNFADRRVWSWNGSGIDFKFDSLNAEQRKYFLDAEPAPPGRALTPKEEQLIQDRIDYIKGARGKEGTGSGKFRPRHSAQGDIVHSNIWHVDAPVSAFPFAGYAQFVEANKDRQPMIYAGGNDGMLHGFSATDGREKFAYVPNGVLPTLRELTRHDYDDHHRAYVDGPVMTGDVNLGGNTAGSSDWRTILVGALGAGGKGYYVLDVSNPNSFGAGNVLLDKTMPASANHGDIGHIFGAPTLDGDNPRKTSQIARLNNDKWAIIMGNGYNSSNRRPVLLIQYLDGTLQTLVAADTVAGEDNGLGAPTLVDLNGDGRPDVVYAGDNMGNLWKFMIADADQNQWGVAFDNPAPAKPLFNAREANPNVGEHPITAAPAVRYSPEAGGMMVAFGTGRNITTTDADNLVVQSVYAVLDRTQYSFEADGHVKACESRRTGCEYIRDDQISRPVTGGRTALVEQRFGDSTTAAGDMYWAVRTEEVDYTAKHGWYLDLNRGSDAGGERLLKAITLGNSSQTLDIFTQIPAKGAIGDTTVYESCEGISPQAGRQFLTRLHIAQPWKKTSFMSQWPEPSREMPDGPLGGVATRDSRWDPGVSTPPGKEEGYIREDGTFIKTGNFAEPLPARPAWWQLQ